MQSESHRYRGGTNEDQREDEKEEQKSEDSEEQAQVYDFEDCRTQDQDCGGN